MITMNYNFSEDLKSIREILALSQSEFASQLRVDLLNLTINKKKKNKQT